jgi:hypothetical protein
MKPSARAASFSGLALVVACLVFAPSAEAADKTPVGSLPRAPAMKDVTDAPEKLGVPGIKLEDHIQYGSLIVDPARGDCLVSTDWGMALDTMGSFSDAKHERWHFVEKDGELSIEIQHIGMAVRNVFVMSRATVKPVRVATEGDLVVWGFRTPGGDVVLLAKGADRGRLSDTQGGGEGVMFRSASSACTYGATVLNAKAIKSGGIAQLAAVRPEKGPHEANSSFTFFVDASIVKTSRDPEPVLAVRIRRVG